MYLAVCWLPVATSAMLMRCHACGMHLSCADKDEGFTLTDLPSPVPCIVPQDRQRQRVAGLLLPPLSGCCVVDLSDLLSAAVELLR